MPAIDPARSVRGTSLFRRLLPLYVATFLAGAGLWVPVEKLFLAEIGFDPASIGVMAAMYAAVPPLIEIPSGILADRWSRRGVLVLSSVAATMSALVGGLSTNVATYFLSAVFLGVYFAMRSGTLEATVYDAVREHTGGSDGFERRAGQVRMVESGALVTGALAGGLVAGMTSPRLTYFLTVPLTALSIVAFLRFREPRLHLAGEATTLRRHLALTYRAAAHQRRLRPVVALSVLTALVMSTIFEFGPLWLVSLAVPAVLYGPHWAGLMSTLGLGGVLAGRLKLHRPVDLAAVVVLLLGTSLVLTTGAGFVAVTVAQVVLVMLAVAAGIHATRLLHDAVPSAVRSGVASGVGALSWMTFLPFALGFGLLSKNQEVTSGGWLVVATAALAGVVLVTMAIGHRHRTQSGASASAVPTEAPPAAARVVSEPAYAPVGRP
jgi:MFS family permease